MAKKAKKKTAKRKLTAKQEAFCREYVLCNNAAKAAINAKYSKKTARTIGQNNLTKVDIQARIKELQTPVLKKFKVTQERLIQELAMIAFSDNKNMYDEDKKLLSIPEMPEEIRRTISGFDQGVIGVSKVKQSDKLKAIELLGKTNAISMFSETVNIKGDLSEVSKDAIKDAGKQIFKDIVKELKD